MFIGFDLPSRLYSPYDLNPLVSIRQRHSGASIDFCRVGAAHQTVFITATNVRTGRGHISQCRDLPDAWFQACLLADDAMFQAVEIDGKGEITVATPVIPPSRRSCARATRKTRSRSRSILASVRERRGRRAKFSTVSTRPFNASLMKELLHDCAPAPGGGSGRGEGARWAECAQCTARLSEMLTDLRLVRQLTPSRISWMLRAEGRIAAAFFEAHCGSFRAAIDRKIWIRSLAEC